MDLRTLSSITYDGVENVIGLLDVLKRLSPCFSFLRTQLDNALIEDGRNYFFVHALVFLEFSVVFRFGDAEEPRELLACSIADFVAFQGGSFGVVPHPRQPLQLCLCNTDHR